MYTHNLKLICIYCQYFHVLSPGAVEYAGCTSAEVLDPPNKVLCGDP